MARSETPYAIKRAYKHGAKERGIVYELTDEQFFSFSGQQCHYCGETLDRPRIDRIDSNRGYTIENCVPCCRKCNYAKHTMSIEEFKQWVKKVYEHIYK